MSADWSLKDVEPPEFIRSEEGVALWIRQIEWQTGPDSGKRGYMASVRAPGRTRTGSVVPNRRIALEDGKEQMDIVLVRLREEIEKQKRRMEEHESSEEKRRGVGL